MDLCLQVEEETDPVAAKAFKELEAKLEGEKTPLVSAAESTQSVRS